MELVALMSLVLASLADFVPGTAAPVGLVAGGMAVWAIPGAVWMSFSTLIYNLLATTFPSPGFILGDLVAEKTPLAEGMAEEIAVAGAEVAIETNYWVLTIHAGLLLYALKRHTDHAVGEPIR